MKKTLQLLVEAVILYFTENSLFCRQKKIQPSLLAYNVDWFTNCNWRDQLLAFKQMDIYYAYKH